MKTCITSLGFAWLSLAMLTDVLANTPARRPLPAPAPQAAPLVILVDPTAQQATLQIPRKLLGIQKTDASNGEKDDNGLAGLAPTHTIAAGLCLALALTTGGLWLARRGRGLFLAMLLLTSVGAATVWADISPRPRPRPPVPIPVPIPVPAIPLQVKDQVAIQIVDQGEAVTLTLTQNQAAQLGGGGNVVLPGQPIAPIQPIQPIRPIQPGAGPR